MQALVLAGGEGTRLRPLTSTQPKPVVPLAGRPLISYLVDWLRRHGVDDVILSCGFLAAGVRAVLGQGEGLGVRLRYVEEPEPLGTAGPLKLAQELLDERFLVLNGDVLTDLDLGAQLERHGRSGARATIALVSVEDPSAYGLVRLGADGAVREFVEKPAPEEIDGDLINAGAYVLERDVLDLIPAGRAVSIEREVFPQLIGAGLYGHRCEGYWLDVGTPERYLQATFDLLEGRVAGAQGVLGADGAGVVGPVLMGPGCVLEAGSLIGPLAVLGSGVEVGRGALIERSVVLDRARIGAHARLRDCVVCADASVGEGSELSELAILGAGGRLGARRRLEAGARIFPGMELPDGAMTS